MDETKKKDGMNSVFYGFALGAVILGAVFLAVYYWFFFQAYRDGQRRGQPPAGSVAAKRIEKSKGQDGPP
jgi:hypothetical protein